MTIRAARPHAFSAVRAGGVFLKLAVLLVLAGCDNVNTDELTPNNFVRFFLRTLCHSSQHCGVREPM